ncbi:MAG: FHA domain-containing protein [Chloroflexi bacterium]|nr:FHA domain-containing protein [Chloroflexota bacterium]MCC6894078.1 FHA domain-containing protein [Anaerolineae bacterium]
MTETKVCTACGKSNAADATVCAHCNTPVVAMLPSKTTSHVPPPPLNPVGFVPERVVQLTRLYSDIVVFQVASFEQPLLVKVSENKVTIGRYSPGEKPPTVDLTPFNGGLMGVSRQHATILKDNDGYKLKDLSSTNGTWLNETRLNANQLYPLQSGDIVRFGQINTSVYFRLAENNDPAETLLSLTSILEMTDPLTLKAATLETLLLPYLKALDGFQKSCDEVMSQPISDVLITSIAPDKSKGVLNIKLTGLYQAYRLLKNHIFRWREAHHENILKLNQPTAEPIKPWVEIEQQPNQTNPLSDNVLNTAGIELAYEILADLAPQRTRAENQSHLAKLLPHLQRLALSPLRPNDSAS